MTLGQMADGAAGAADLALEVNALRAPGAQLSCLAGSFGSG